MHVYNFFTRWQFSINLNQSNQTQQIQTFYFFQIGQNSKHSKPGIFIEGGIHARSSYFF